ncbi:hypothetical protein TNCV_4826251 [Trichonephila clavipes]|uniref:Uncharacterized protein n=1 Tax=Trichonephila clavipes TaxID=2585209 RepID=A0A8X6UWN5_TRICX|nr:hypothetical protein TNCV_4826251 [Trichonephila clavipes]
MNLCGTRTPPPPCFSIEVNVLWRGGVNWPQNQRGGGVVTFNFSEDNIGEGQTFYNIITGEIPIISIGDGGPFLRFRKSKAFSVTGDIWAANESQFLHTSGSNQREATQLSPIYQKISRKVKLFRTIGPANQKRSSPSMKTLTVVQHLSPDMELRATSSPYAQEEHRRHK